MPRLRVLAKFLVPIAVIAAGVYVHARFLANWMYAWDLFLGFVLAVWTAVIAGGRMRSAATVAASVLFCLVAVESYALVTQGRPTDTHTAGFTVLDPVLGWGTRPGVYSQTKNDAKTGKILAEAVYTIDAHGHRNVISAPDGPTVAFFGDSMTFGEGVQDPETMPQLFADLSERRLHVVNLAFPGYGPQQFLRALETDLFQDLLKQPRLFVFMTAPWHAERSACLRGYVLRAPRYELIDGQPTFQGPCRGQLYALLAGSFTYRRFVEPALVHVGPAQIDLYIAILVRAGQVAREKYGVPTVILYMPAPRYAEQAGSSDEEIMRRLRNGGLKVIDAGLDQRDFPGQPLEIPGDGHPTGVANRARAKLLYSDFGDVLSQAH